MPETTQTVWPEGVIARYLTVGGATVDLSHAAGHSGTTYETQAVCSGCPDKKAASHWRGSGSSFNGTYTEEHRSDLADKEARTWAQAHAERCRAVPRPTA